MSRPGSARRSVASLALVVLVSGCAVFDPRTEPQPVGAGPPTALACRVETQAWLWEGAAGLDPSGSEHLVELPAATELRGGVMRGLEASGLFALVAEPGDGAAYRAEIQVTTYESPLMDNLWFLLTAFLYPAHTDHRVDVRVRVVDLESQFSIVAERSESFRGWYELFLLPLAITRPNPHAYQADLAGHLAREATAEAFVQLRTRGSR